jgi:hypothetical protein
MTFWLEALSAVTTDDRAEDRSVRRDAALSEVALTYWTRIRSRPPAGMTTWLRVLPASPVLLKGIIAVFC